jgi:hypothetical protein
VKAVDEVLRRADIHNSCFGNLGVIDWLVPKKEFLRARKTLLAAKDRRVRKQVVGPPKFSF